MCTIVIAVEIEARDACYWLLAAGFPQYVQLYEGTLRHVVSYTVGACKYYLQFRPLCKQINVVNVEIHLWPRPKVLEIVYPSLKVRLSIFPVFFHVLKMLKLLEMRHTLLPQSLISTSRIADGAYSTPKISQMISLR